MSNDIIIKKATLALGGGVRLPEGFQLPFRISHSTAGPGAGNDAVVFSFHGMRVKKGVSYNAGEFELHDSGGELSLYHKGELFIDNVAIEPVIYHCPEQAFFTLDPGCSYSCAFCASPRLPASDHKHLTDREIAQKCADAYRDNRIVAVSLTSGVPAEGIQAGIDRFVSCIREIRKVLPDIPLGVEPYTDTEDQIKALKDAGADEIKLNVQASTDELFEKICPELDRDRIFQALEYAVKYFGRGKVTSNIIFGLGETKEELEACMERISRIGAIPTVRSLRYNKYNGESLKAAIGTPEKVSPGYMLEIADLHKRVLERNGLNTRSFGTMCLECGCCDIVPNRDI